MSKKLTLDYIGNQEYRSENGRTVKREAEYDGNWVYRNAQGKMIDADKFREALCFRNNLELKQPQGGLASRFSKGGKYDKGV